MAGTDAATEPRSMSDLSDHELARLTSELRQEQANERPLIGVVEELARLREEYGGDTEGARMFRAKIDGLERDGWTGVRRTRGDGDCWYRSFAFAYLERLVSQPASAAELALSKIESLLPLLDQAGFMPDIYDDFYDPLRSLLRALAGIAAGASTNESRPTTSSLHASFNDPEVSNSIVVFLRLLTSAFLRANSDDFTPFLFALDNSEDAMHILDPESGMPDMVKFCGWCVEAVNKEADHIQLVALTRALQIHIRVAYLDPSAQAAQTQSTATSGGDRVDCDWVLFEEDASESLGEGRAVLYRPGHYDLLYR